MDKPVDADHKKNLAYFESLKKQGISKEQEDKILLELKGDQTHSVPELHELNQPIMQDHLYSYSDLLVLQQHTRPYVAYQNYLKSLDELLEQDRKRESDGFPRKIRVGRLVKPGKGGKDKVVVVPTTVEEKLIHDRSIQSKEDEDASGGAGEGEEGDVIGEQPIHSPNGSGEGPGEGEGGPHEVESSAYDLGRILTEQFELPNLKDKGKKRSLTRYTYDMTDRNRGYGQILDKKATLKKIVETNIHLGNLPDPDDIDPTRFLISPSDRIYRILSREKDFESQAMVFFLRDYSGSMTGKPTEVVVSQHVLIYSWILYQYARQVETRFILHDTDATEVNDFYTYYNSKVAGGTRVSSAYKLVNEIVEQENLKSDYNIYIFHGTDGDDWDTEGKEAIPELKKMITYASRVGITIAERTTGYQRGTSEVQEYLEKSGLLMDFPELIRMDVVSDDANETRLIESIRNLIS
ncbi:protein containing DUF444 [Candidatus Magnetomorum sp. HK-1]|nr:protein containing DUF444 [Candidatus Magnetomorum sp. HK-1]